MTVLTDELFKLLYILHASIATSAAPLLTLHLLIYWAAHILLRRMLV